MLSEANVKNIKVSAKIARACASCGTANPGFEPVCPQCGTPGVFEDLGVIADSDHDNVRLGSLRRFADQVKRDFRVEMEKRR